MQVIALLISWITVLFGSYWLIRRYCSNKTADFIGGVCGVIGYTLLGLFILVGIFYS